MCCASPSCFSLAALMRPTAFCARRQPPLRPPRVQVRSEAFLPELIESDATWQGEDHTRAAWANLTEHRIAFTPRVVGVVPQVGVVPPLPRTSALGARLFSRLPRPLRERAPLMLIKASALSTTHLLPAHGVSQVGPSIFDAADATTEWRTNETAADGCRECRWRTPEEARAARDQRRAYAGAVWFAGSAATVALWVAAGYLVLKVL